MSKISLEPNVSGAGTFTLAAPNSNTNRTLNLPDEAGTILSDASTIDSNNLQSDVYKQDNVVGTVSESGGVPTGAIIESGSNANGEFVKYADGTQICFRRLTDSEVENTSTNIDTTFFSYPATFSVRPIPLGLITDRPIVLVTSTFDTLESFSYTCNNNSRWNARLRTSLGSQARAVNITAFGRWY